MTSITNGGGFVSDSGRDNGVAKYTHRSKPTYRRGVMGADLTDVQFTRISNELFRDPRVSYRAKGLFGFISTHRDGWGLTIDDMTAFSPHEGVKALRTAIDELKRYGYLISERTRNPDGTLGPSVYYITDIPHGMVIAEPAPYGIQDESPQDGPANERLPRSEPKCPEGVLDVTCENTPEDPPSGPRLPRSEPKCPQPHVAEGLLKNDYKKNHHPPTPQDHAEGGEAEDKDLDREARALYDSWGFSWKIGIGRRTKADIIEFIRRALVDGLSPEELTGVARRPTDGLRNVHRGVLSWFANDLPDPAEPAPDQGSPLAPHCGDPLCGPYGWLEIDGPPQRCPQWPHRTAGTTSQNPNWKDVRP